MPAFPLPDAANLPAGGLSRAASFHLRQAPRWRIGTCQPSAFCRLPERPIMV